MKVYRSISRTEFARLMLGIPITGIWNASRFHPECSYSGYFGGVVCAFTDKIQWKDSDHSIFLELDIPETNIVQEGTGTWMMPKSFATTKVYKGRAGDEKHELGEVFFKEYDIRNISKIIDIPNAEYILNEIYRYYYFRCPPYRKEKRTRAEALAELEEYMKKFPDANTAIPKKEYEDAFHQIAEMILEGV